MKWRPRTVKFFLLQRELGEGVIELRVYVGRWERIVRIHASEDTLGRAVVRVVVRFRTLRAEFCVYAFQPRSLERVMYLRSSRGCQNG